MVVKKINDVYDVILGSGSPRRRELLKALGLNYSVVTSRKEEVQIGSKTSEIVENLAKDKAEDVWNNPEVQARRGKPVLVITADTVVDFEGTILGKPKDIGDAFRMLSMLSGKKNTVYTGVCIKTCEKEECFHVETDVFFAKLTNEEIWDYIDSGEPMDKAGGYGIQGSFQKHVTKIEGDYYNVVGLPVAETVRVLNSFLKSVKTESCEK